MTNDLILEQLRCIRSDIASVREDTREIQSRLVVLAGEVAGLRRNNADFAAALSAARRSPHCPAS